MSQAPLANQSPDAAVKGPSDLDVIIEGLCTPFGVLPVEVLRRAQQQRDAIVPRLIDLIDRARKQALDGKVPPTNGHFFALFLLAEFQAAEALGTIIRAVSLPGELPFDLFGDAIHECLPCAFAAMAADRIDILASLNRNREVDEYVRWAAASALAKMVAAGLQPRDKIVELLRELLREATASGDKSVLGLVHTLIELYPEEAQGEIQHAFARDLLDPFDLSPDDVADTLVQTKEDVLAKLDRRDIFVKDTVETLKEWHAFAKPREPVPIASKPRPVSPPSLALKTARSDLIGEQVAIHRGTIRPAGDRIGRNERCPCGSGKKFKRCCGAASRDND